VSRNRITAFLPPSASAGWLFLLRPTGPDHPLIFLLGPSQGFVAAGEKPGHQQRAVSEHPHFAPNRHEPHIAGRDLAVAVQRPEL